MATIQEALEKAGKAAELTEQDLARCIDGLKELQYDRGQYEKGYATGYAAAIEDFAERLKKYYNNLNGTTSSGLVAYHIEQIKKEMLEKNNLIINI